MKYKMLLVVPLVAAMGQSLPPPGPVQLPRAGDSAAAAPAAPQPDAVPQPDARKLSVTPATDVAPADLVGATRPLVIFADSEADPAFSDQLSILERSPAALAERDVVVIVDADPGARSAWRQWLRPEGFSLVLVDKDGQVKLRKPLPWSVREITRAIDKFPSRRQEIGRAGILP